MTTSPADRHLMRIGFPGGLTVSASFRGHDILTDQPEKAGGGNAAPPPFDLFLASIGTCVGFYALRFCQSRGIATEGLAVTLEPVRDPAAGGIGSIRIDIQPPPGFPKKYRRAVLRAVDQCAVKRHIVQPPEFVVTLSEPPSISP